MRPFGILPCYMRTYSICISSLGLVCLLPTKHFGAELNPSTLSHSLACSEARFSLAQKVIERGKDREKKIHLYTNCCRGGRGGPNRNPFLPEAKVTGSESKGCCSRQSDDVVYFFSFWKAVRHLKRTVPSVNTGCCFGCGKGRADLIFSGQCLMNTDRKQRLFRHFAEISKWNVTERGLP
ncbi:hypothetical protein CEXT_80381 [Caerostris extrusa]|uniref:Uncharacterized protein n=1 Tax=Caerostris extrusa TaxID=172846 RepID=A0AAV4SBY2_CAEEX|nr:hypothetical protein CEXT_80381 [Caerostris extrusa]